MRRGRGAIPVSVRLPRSALQQHLVLLVLQVLMLMVTLLEIVLPFLGQDRLKRWHGRRLP